MWSLIPFCIFLGSGPFQSRNFTLRFLDPGLQLTFLPVDAVLIKAVSRKNSVAAIRNISICTVRKKNPEILLFIGKLHLTCKLIPFQNKLEQSPDEQDKEAHKHSLPPMKIGHLAGRLRDIGK